MKLLFYLLILTLSIIIGCSNDDPVQPQQEQVNTAVDSGWTDSQGKTMLDLGEYRIDATIKDSVSHLPISRAFVQAYRLDGKIFVFANDTVSGHYLGFKTIDIGSTLADSLKDEPITIGLVLALTNITLMALEINEGIDVYDNGWLEKVCYNPDYNDLFSVVTFGLGTKIKNTGTVIKIGPNAATKLGILPKSFIVTKEAFESADIFLSLLTNQINFMDADIARICMFKVKNFPIYLPLIYIEDVELRREVENKITLTWGLNPRDIDAHIWTPVISGSSYHVYYASKGSLTNYPFVNLDVDDVTSYGPENITIKNLYSGTYKIAIHHYAGTGTITSSGAIVKILSKNFAPFTIYVPIIQSGSRWWWYVGDIDGTTKAFTLKNIIQPGPPVITDDMPAK